MTELPILDESQLLGGVLADLGANKKPALIQIGANDGRTESAKTDGLDFVFEFLRHAPHWRAVLIEPLPAAFAALKRNYQHHENDLSFLRCAVTERFEHRTLHVTPGLGKASSLHADVTARRKIEREIVVPCLPYNLICSINGLAKVDFVKIDAEGYDRAIVQNILERAAPRVVPPVIYWEYPNPRIDPVDTLLSDRGYRVFRTGRTADGHLLDRVAIDSSISPGLVNQDLRP